MMNNQEFVAHFMSKHDGLITKICSKYQIPNRYDISDIKQYIVEKMLNILLHRQDSDNKILDREKYFKQCIEWYCVEYQRMHGYIFDLPKRPRKHTKEAELEIKSRGMKYLGDMSQDEVLSLVDKKPAPQTTEIKGDTPWASLTGLLDPDDANVIMCIYGRGMSWPETAKYLDVAQSTCWSRRSRAMSAIFRAFDGLTGEMKDNVKRYIRGDPEVIQAIADSRKD